MLLAAITLLPLVGALLVMITPKEEESIHRGLGLTISIATFFVSLLLLPDFDATQAGFQMEINKPWVT